MKVWQETVFGKNLGRILKERNITQNMLAKKINVDTDVVSRWCTGRSEPSLAKMILVKNVLQVTWNDLLEECNES